MIDKSYKSSNFFYFEIVIGVTPEFGENNTLRKLVEYF